MRLNDLLKDIEVEEIRGEITAELTNLNTDSRMIETNGIFVAQTGTQVDGHNYIQNAIKNGASVIVHDKYLEEYQDNVVYVRVADTADAIGVLASVWYGHPSRMLQLVGVIGTNGKTTTTTLLYNLFKHFGYKVGLISTIINKIGDKEIMATHTTPDPLSLNRLLREMVDAGCSYAFMEVSSHAIHQKRINGLLFQGGIFTNLSQDHLDYHQTMKEYLKAKKAFFDNLPSSSFALTNVDDKNGEVMLQNTKATKYSYSLKGLADFKGRVIEKRFDSTLLEINQREVDVQFVGLFNMYNLLGVYAAAILLGREPQETLIGLSLLKPVLGRFETLYSPEGYIAIVDYAHTPDAVKNVLETIREMIGKDANIITVVGSGGNRDKTKRPLMAQEAYSKSNMLILTSDNPRFEEPMEIIDNMADGLTKMQMQNTLLIADRRQAIKTACALAKKGDIILIAGKGHEDYQDIKGRKFHFSDKEEILNIFNS